VQLPDLATLMSKWLAARRQQGLIILRREARLQWTRYYIFTGTLIQYKSPISQRQRNGGLWQALL